MTSPNFLFEYQNNELELDSVMLLLAVFAMYYDQFQKCQQNLVSYKRLIFDQVIDRKKILE